MNANLDLNLINGSFFLNKKTTLVLTEQSRKIFFIVTFALGLIATSYFIYSRYRLRERILKEKKPQKVVQSNFSNPTFPKEKIREEVFKPIIESPPVKKKLEETNISKGGDDFSMDDLIEFENEFLKEEQEDFNKNTEISDLRKEMREAYHQIKSLREKIEDLSEGVEEVLLDQLSFLPDDELTIRPGEKVKAKEYKGKLYHRYEGEEYKIVSEDQALEYQLKGSQELMDEKVVVIRAKNGRCFTYSYTSYSTDKTKPSKLNYYFVTNWEGNGVLPWIKGYWLAPRKKLNEKVIQDYQVEFDKKKEKLKVLKEKILDLSKHQ